MIPKLYITKWYIPKWYTQRPSDRIRRLVSRLSIGRVIRDDELLSICKRLSRRLSSPGRENVIRSVCGGWTAVANGKWISCRGFWVVGRHFFTLVVRRIVGACMWCGTPLFEPDHRKRDRHCKSRLCRELYAVLIGKHQKIRIRCKWTAGRELAKTKFVAMFYLRKYQLVKREARQCLEK